MTAHGTSRTSVHVRLESAKRAKADIDQIAVTNRDFMSTRPTLLTLRRHAGGLDHRGDAGNLALDQLLQAGGAAVRTLGRRAAELNVTRLNRRIVERLAERVRELCDDLLRRVLGGDHGDPGAAVEVENGF